MQIVGYLADNFRTAALEALSGPSGLLDSASGFAPFGPIRSRLLLPDQAGTPSAACAAGLEIVAIAPPECVIRGGGHEARKGSNCAAGPRPRRSRKLSGSATVGSPRC